MCGISGLFDALGRRPVSHDLLGCMNAAQLGFAVLLAHWIRGPLRAHAALLDGAGAQAGSFERRALEHLMSAHQSGRDRAPLRGLLMFDAFLCNVGNLPPARIWGAVAPADQLLAA